MFLKCVLAYLIRLIREPREARSVSAWVPDLLSNACLFPKDTLRRGGRKKPGGFRSWEREERFPVLRGGAAVLMLFGLCRRDPSPGVASVLLLAPSTAIRGKISGVRSGRVMWDKAGLCLSPLRISFPTQKEAQCWYPHNSLIF